MKAVQLFVSLSLLILLATNGAAAQSSADYTLTFTSTWSAITHPVDFPPGPHYSPLRGVTHNSSVTFWKEDSLASGGIRQMAETGNNTGLNSEIETAKIAGTAQNDILGSGLSPSPGSITVSFNIVETHPLVSVVAMLAPSPDWFIGLNGVNLFDGGSWVDDVTYTLYAYDAGTDSGTSYLSSNQVSAPFVNIFQIPDGSFFVDGSVKPVGTIRFERDTVLSIELPELEETAALLTGPYPNPSDGRTTFEIDLDRSKQVHATVYDVLGRQVMVLQNGPLSSGRTVFQIVTESFPSGLYFLTVTTAQGSTTRPISVLH